MAENHDFMTNLFKEQQSTSLEDNIETSIMLQYNSHTRH